MSRLCSCTLKFTNKKTDSVQTVAELVLVCISSGYLAISVPILATLLFFLRRFYLRTSRQLRFLELESKSPLYSYFISSFSGLITLRAFSWSEQCNLENLKRLDVSQSPSWLLYAVQRWICKPFCDPSVPFLSAQVAPVPDDENGISRAVFIVSAYLPSLIKSRC
jgi:hypothetical protein